MIAVFCTGCFEIWLCFYAQVKEWGETPLPVVPKN